jgi:DNA-binding XRE family transcriptional regulator
MSAKGRSGDKDPNETGAVAAGKIEAETEGAREAASGRTTDTTAKSARAGGDLPDDQEALRAEIDETRAELGETVEALSAKADVKRQTKAKVDEGKAQLRDQQVRAKAKLAEVSEQARSNPTPFAAAAGGAVALLLVVRRLRRRRSS